MFSFELSEQMTMVIVEALSNHKYREAAPVISEIQRQVNRQVAARQVNGGKPAEERPDNAA